MIQREHDFIEANGLDDIQIFGHTSHRHRPLHSQVRYVPSQNLESLLKLSAPSLEEPKRDDDMNSKAVTKTDMWIGIGVSLLGVVAIAVGAAWSISNSIHENISASRQELTGVINTSKSDLATRVDKLEDKVDRGFTNTTNGINDIKIILAGQKTTETQKSKD